MWTLPGLTLPSFLLKIHVSESATRSHWLSASCRAPSQKVSWLNLARQVLVPRLIRFIKWLSLPSSKTGVAIYLFGGCFSIFESSLACILKLALVSKHAEKARVMAGKTVMVRLLYDRHEFCWLFLPASAPSSPIKNRPSSSVLKAVSSSSVARTAESIFAASRSFDDRSKSAFLLVLLNLLIHSFSPRLWWSCQKWSSSLHVYGFRFRQALVVAPVSKGVEWNTCWFDCFCRLFSFIL